MSLSEATLAAMVQICQHVAGMPLAIELAAAGARTLPITEIERQIRSNLDVLATTLRDMPARHRSLRAVFDHSWNLLDEPERALLSRLAVFRGGCTLEAAGQVAEAMLPALTMLVDKSLVRQASTPDVTVEPRFFLLEPIREYASEKLAARDEAAALQRAHAVYYLALAESIAAQWDSPTADAALEQLNREHDNMRAVLQWALDGGDRTIGFHLGGALARFWRSRGYISEGRVWFADLLALEHSADASMLAARLRATRWAAWLASDQHDFAHAAQLLEQSMALRQALGVTEDETETNLLIVEALQARAAGQYQRATRLLEDTIARHRATGNRESVGNSGLGLALQLGGGVVREQGNFAYATELLEECLLLHRELGDHEGMVTATLGLGDIARDQGDPARARKYSEESLAVSRDLGMHWASGFALNNLALAAYLAGDLPRAGALSSESVALFRDIQADSSLAEVLISHGQMLRAQGDLAAARAAMTEALQLAWTHGPRLLVALALEGLAGVMAQPGPAVHLIGAAAALRAEMGTPMRPIDRSAVEHVLATARAALGAERFATVWEAAGKLPIEQLLHTILQFGTKEEFEGAAPQ